MSLIIFWDFDGVLMNSNAIRDKGFERVLDEYPKNEVDNLMNFHRSNGGLSRYVKFRYFFEKIRNESISEEEVLVWAKKFSEIMVSDLNNPDLLIEETMLFVKRNYKNISMHIVSGSDQTELRYLTKQLGIADYFKSIHGSPTPKNILVEELIMKNNYFDLECVLIGDSINDYQAAMKNNIYFVAYNNNDLNKLSNYSISFDGPEK